MLSTSLELSFRKEKKRKKHKRITEVTIEAGKAAVPVESTGVKRKELTGRDYKSRYEALASGRRKKHKNSQGEKCVLSASNKKRHMEEHVPSTSNRKRRLKKKYLQCSPGREDIAKEISNIDERRSPILSDESNIVNYAVPLQQKLSLENKSAEIDLVNEIRKECEKRMKILVQKQEQQIQEFNEVWEDKMSKVLVDKKLEAAIIRSIYGKSSATMDKLMILDDEFAKKEAENMLLKDMQLKDLEAEQLASRNEESEKAASLLSEAEVNIYGKEMSCCKANSLDSQDEKDSGCSESRKRILGAKDAGPSARQHEQNNNSCRTAEEVECNASNGNPSNLVQLSTENDGGISFTDILIPAVVEKINQPKHNGDGKSICPNVPASGEMQSLELQGDAAAELPESVVNEIVVNNPVDLSTNSPIEGFRERDAVDLPDAFLNPRNEMDGTDLDSAGQVLKTSKQTKPSPHPCLTLQLQAQEDQDQSHTSSAPEVVVSELVDTATTSTQELEKPVSEIQSSAKTDIATSKIVDTVIANQSSINLQDPGAPVVQDLVFMQKEVVDLERVDTAVSVANSELFGTAQTLQSNIERQDPVEPAVEIQSTSRIEVAPSKNMNNTTPVWSSTAVQDEDASTVQALSSSDSGLADIATPVQSHIDGGPAIENCEQPRVMPIDNSPSCNQLSSIELASQNDNPGRISFGAGETEMPSDGSTSQLRDDVEPQSNNLDVGPGSQSSLEYLTDSFQNNVDLEIEIPHQDTLLLGGVSHLPIHEVAARNSPSLFANPLVNELERNRKEAEELQKSHENTMSCLKSECAKQIQELVTEIQNKYKLKLQDAQAQFRLKKNGLDQNLKKIFMNKLLADSLSFNCWNALPTGHLIQQGSTSSSIQHLQHFTRPSGANAGNSVSNLHIASLNGQAMQHISVPPSTRPGQIHAASSVQAHLAAAFSSSIARAGVVTNPNLPTTYPRFGGDARSSAPQSQVFAPAAPPAVPAASWSSFLGNYHQLQQQQQWQQRPSSSRNPQHLGYPAGLAHTSLTAFGVQHHPLVPGNNTSSLPETNSSFGSLQQCYNYTQGNAQANQSFFAPATNAICLSDDD